jgi:hypothetical protein
MLLRHQLNRDRQRSEQRYRGNGTTMFWTS